MTGKLHLIKLCVGIDSVEDLIAWRAQNTPKGAETRSQHITRMWPKRAAELLDGGSLYWVIKGVVQARQRILSLDEVTGRDGVSRCAIVMDPALVRTAPVPRRPFQGWRYLPASDAPPDLHRAGKTRAEDAPPALLAALAEIGVR